MMEVSVFPKLHNLLKNFVEIRLHTDSGPNHEQLAALQVKLTNSETLPIYLVVDPDDPNKPLGRVDGSQKRAFENLLQEHVN